MNQIFVNPLRTISQVDHNIFGGFAEHMARCVYGGIYDPESPLADEFGLRQDVIAALRRLNMPLIRYPGGNFVSGYRWRDGIGPASERPARTDLAWHVVDTNEFGTNEFMRFCRQMNTEPFLVVNCGDGDMREARDWVEYCNGTQPTALVKLRHQHGFDAPHQVKYWGVGNEVDGHWQIGAKKPLEYARALTEFSKVMKWVDPTIKLIASGLSDWAIPTIERLVPMLEQAGDWIDLVDIHWYFNNIANDFAAFMTSSEVIEQRLAAVAGLIHAVTLDRRLRHPIHINVGEWNVVYRTDLEQGIEEVYNLEDALVIALHLNAFIRHADMVKMANLAQIVNMIAPIRTTRDGLVLQTIFYPFEVYSQHCGPTALDVFWQGDTFEGGGYTGVRVLDVAGTLDEQAKQLALFIVNRTQDQPSDVQINLEMGQFTGRGQVYVVNGPDIKARNTFETPDLVTTRSVPLTVTGSTMTLTLEPHSVTVMLLDIT